MFESSTWTIESCFLLYQVYKTQDVRQTTQLLLISVIFLHKAKTKIFFTGNTISWKIIFFRIISILNILVFLSLNDFLKIKKDLKKIKLILKLKKWFFFQKWDYELEKEYYLYLACPIFYAAAIVHSSGFILFYVYIDPGHKKVMSIIGYIYY